jgi:DNA-binding Lrp family transcriptional regulator
LHSLVILVFFFTGSEMKLTQRQNDFIGKLLELYQESATPIHYSEIANRLGVSDITAYDMLRLLEEKGLVSSHYELPAKKAGPGRSKITFLPTPRAHHLMGDLVDEALREGWESIKERLLAKFAESDLEAEELAQEVLARIPPEGRDPLHYCVEIMTIIALRLRSSSGRSLLLEFLPDILPSSAEANRVNLNLLGGFAMGILAHENRDDPVWGQELLEHVKHYQTYVIEMNTKEHKNLATHLQEVFDSLRGLS